jgi:hypothetical protein
MTKLELLSNATTIDHALEYIRSKQSQQSQKKANEDTNDSNSQLTAANATAAGKQSVF